MPEFSISNFPALPANRQFPINAQIPIIKPFQPTHGSQYPFPDITEK